MTTRSSIRRSLCLTMRSHSRFSRLLIWLRASRASSLRTLASSACLADSGSTSSGRMPSCLAVRVWICAMACCTKASPARSSQRMSILLSTANRQVWVSSSSWRICCCQTAKSLAVTPVSADSRKMIAWALGSIDRVSSGSLPRAFRPGVSRMRRPWRSSG
ncbi:hypothetical protein D3C86_1416400 [compost metagenome]